ncbi:LOW QUALITY PROTEIN: peroxisomal membrane protein 4 [Dermochelys coriacea]|uniref:LOW QUALITY PROTEIN: peroxisomal membrane protein 4 n=1 Tax=Dermochelys coriacea TaxID=27794 RepID=UPI0018E7CE93|nr:LOW QUALITY PROTEIN: peroxisomal membrane protein 4 [Dermochelys coriacea]
MRNLTLVAPSVRTDPVYQRSHWLCALPRRPPPRSVAAMGAQAMLKTLLYTVNSLLQRRRYRAALAVLKGFRNGAVYGAKIRAPHALVMTFLFKSGSLREKLKAIAQATYTHSRNLAYFVFTYKGLMALQSRLQGKNFQLHSFLAACVGGWLVFGENNHINSQINMYLLSRILFGLSRLAVEKGYIPEPKQDPFPIFAAVTWGIVLWLFEYHRHTLQPSLQSSMTYLYDDSNVWHDISDFLIYNKSNAQK